MVNIENLREFVSPFYHNKDIMHDLSHIERVLHTSYKLMVYLDEEADEDLIIYAAYFHGFIYSGEKAIVAWLEKQGIDETEIQKIVKTAWESQKDENAETLEGQLLHDAHMVEGGRLFLALKSMITGSVRGQTLAETIAYIEKNVLGKGVCYIQHAQEIHHKAQLFARSLVEELKTELGECLK